MLTDVRREFLSAYYQEKRKGGFSKGGFCRVECHAQGNKKYPRIFGPAVRLALRAPQPREAYMLQKPPSKNPLLLALSLLFVCQSKLTEFFFRRTYRVCPRTQFVLSSETAAREIRLTTRASGNGPRQKVSKSVKECQDKCRRRPDYSSNLCPPKI